MHSKLIITILVALIIKFVCSVSISLAPLRQDVVTESESIATPSRPSLAEYNAMRINVMAEQAARDLGADVKLTEKELRANDILMSAKLRELDTGHFSPYKLAPSQHMFEVLDKIKASAVFKILRKMPKGAILHSHDMALCSADYLVAITYREDLWQCNNSATVRPKFLFSNKKPLSMRECEWTLVAMERQRVGADVYDVEVRKLFTLFTDNPLAEFKDIKDVWTRFMNIFMVIGPILTYAPVWKDYYKQALKEFYADGVQYLEFRGSLPEVYDLDGKIFTPEEIIRMYKSVLNEYKRENPEFIGSKFIYAPLHTVDGVKATKYIEQAVALHNMFPEFVAGFDLVGQEDMSRPLVQFVDTLLQMPATIKFFFHTGETKWIAQSDENLVDAVLLGTSRVGHGVALLKNPTILQIIKQRGIAIEVNLASNQILKLVLDYRNHPAKALFADNYPVVISADGRSFWEALPLSHDFYVAFMGIASRQQDLRFLKRLAHNSLQYSAMTGDEKRNALQMWQRKWDKFIDEIIGGGVGSAPQKRPLTFITLLIVFLIFSTFFNYFL